MSVELTIDQLRLALNVKDPQLADYILRLSNQIEPKNTPIREGVDTFDAFLHDIRTLEFRKKPKLEQWSNRAERLKALESEQALSPIPERLKLHEIILQLYEQNNAYSRRCLLNIIPEIPLNYGPWRALKIIFKQSEVNQDTEMYGALSARFDHALSTNQTYQVNRSTLIYLTRRAWRHLRRVGEQIPTLYPDLACDVLAHYRNPNWSRTWIANHIFYHEDNQYNRNHFTYHKPPRSLLQHRAFTDSWRLTPRPLFALLERAQSKHVREYACEAIKSDFRSSLRDIEPSWIRRLTGTQSTIIDNFVVWVLQNAPKFEQSQFHELDLHNTVIALFDSTSTNARQYAAEYARIHARNLDLSTLIHLLNNDHEPLRQLAMDLINSKDPFNDVGLDAWGHILDTRFGYSLAQTALLKHFTKKELTTDWFFKRLLLPGSPCFTFAAEHLTKQYSLTTIGASYFCRLLDELDYQNYRTNLAIDFAFECLRHLTPDQLNPEFLQRALINTRTRRYITNWIDEGRLSNQAFGIVFFKNLCFHPAWKTNTWLQQLPHQYTWAKDLEFDESLADIVLGWLSDIRNFTPEQLTFEWLMVLVVRSEPRYHDFAVNVMKKGFLPADFAPQDTQSHIPEPASSAVDIDINLNGESFLFTGKLSKMSRAESKKKVTMAGGSNVSSVTKNLNWLVIGDEGSPLYDNGRKGSKQVKAEELITKGANLKIISESAFLQMLEGKQRTFSKDRINTGCEQLWQMLTQPGKDDAPLMLFALSYLRHHHPDICLAETDRPVDPGSEIPPEFLSFERIKPLFNDTRSHLRNFALDIAKLEFTRWHPPIFDLIELSESQYLPVRKFITDTLTAEDDIHTRRYRLNCDLFKPEDVYRFCESKVKSTRDLGMHLIQQYTHLQNPDALYHLTEHTDRAIRGFAIQQLWKHYHHRGITSNWRAPTDEKPLDSKQGTSISTSPVMTELSASHADLQQLLRRTLFDIAPGRLAQSTTKHEPTIKSFKSTTTRTTKLKLIESLRDMAVEELDFARCILPLLTEFKNSNGKSEHAACLVAITRICHKYPTLNGQEYSI